MKSPVGADLVIPALALAFAAYFFYSIVDLAWEAKANGIVIGTVLVVLIVIQVVRSARELARGQGELSFDSIVAPRDALGKRIGIVIITVLFIVTLPWLGLTLGLLIALFASLWLMGVRRRIALVAVPVGVATAAYLLFVALLHSDIPHGPIERLLS